MTFIVEALGFRVVGLRDEVGIASDSELISRRCKPPSDLDLGVLA